MNKERQEAGREVYRKQARVMKALAHEARLMIVHRLADGECSAGTLVALVGSDPSTVSKHLSILRLNGIIGDRREGTTIYYRLLTPCALNFLSCATKTIAELR